jgi:transposase InsO family protein
MAIENKTKLAKTICPIRPNVLWVGDFTYLPWQDGFIYAATVMDIFTREILGWSLGLRHTSALVIDALMDALQKTNARPLIFHSDQGSEYASNDHESILKKLNSDISYSKKASPWENPFQESFYNNFKLEMGNINRFVDLGALTEAVAQQLTYYNTSRIHTSLKMSPQRFKARYLFKTKTTTPVAVVANNYLLSESPKSV